LVDDGDIVQLVDAGGANQTVVARRPTLIENALLFLTAEENGQWRIASLVGDSVPTPGLPPTWNEGWKYVDRKRRELRV